MPKRKRPFSLHIGLKTQGAETFQANPTIAAGDFSTFTDGVDTGTPTTTVEPGSSRNVKVELTAAMMDARESVVIEAVDAAGSEWAEMRVTIPIDKEPGVYIDDDVTVTSQTVFTIANGPSDDDALNNMPVRIYDTSSTINDNLDEYDFHQTYVTDYVGSTKTVTIAAAPDFTMATGDIVEVLYAPSFHTLNDPTAAAIRTEMDSNSTQLSAIVGDTNELQTDWADGGRLDAILDARASQTTADAIETDTQDIQSKIGTPAGASMSADIATIDTNVDSVLADTGTDGVVVGSINAGAVDSILDESIPEPSAVFSWPSTLRNIIGWLGALSRNKITQTSSTQTLRNDADSANIATSAVSDDGTTATRDEFS